MDERGLQLPVRDCKEKSGVFLREKSSNNIWGNSKKVGKDNMWPFEHNSETCFLGSNKNVFIFMLMEATSDSFPPELTTKYMVSKVLAGEGHLEVSKYYSP